MLLNLNNMAKLTIENIFVLVFMAFICVISAISMQDGNYVFVSALISLTSAVYCIIVPIKMMTSK